MKEEFTLGSWLVEPHRLTLSGGGKSVTIKPRSMAVLVELAHADGEVVERAALLDRVWGDAEVTDDVLTQSIVELRRAFSDDARHPRYIETIARVGYRLIATPGPAIPTNPPARRRAPWIIGTVAAVLVVLAAVTWLVSAPNSAVEPLSVAVLPFANLSADEGHFADGVAEELLDALAQVPSLRVVARTSSFAFRDRNLDVSEIGRHLRVAYLVEGSVRRSGNRIRVAAQLIETADGYHRWSRTYEYDLGDIFQIQRQIAGDVADALAVNLGATVTRATTENPKAYELYLAGKHHARRGHIKRAIELFDQATTADPTYALAHAELAKALTFFQENPGGVRQSGADFKHQVERAKGAAATAMMLAPDQADVLIAQAAIAVVERDTHQERAALERAIALNPASVEAYMRLSQLLVSTGEYAQANTHLQTAAKLDPLNPQLAVEHARLIALLDGYDAAVARLERLIALDLTSRRLWDARLELAADFGRYVDRVRYAVRLEQASPDAAWPKAQLGDAFTELGALDLADVWIAAAERISPIEAFKSRARWFAATRNFEAFARLTREALASSREDSAPMSPAQSAFTGLSAIAALNTGDPAQGVRLLQRFIALSPTVRRRKPHTLIYSEILLARALQATEDQAGLRDTLTSIRTRIEAAERAGVANYPWLTLTSAVTYKLAGDADAASRAFRTAVSQGWRAWYLEQYAVAQPLSNELGTIELVETDLARMREIVSREGFGVPPAAPTKPTEAQP